MNRERKIDANKKAPARNVISDRRGAAAVLFALALPVIGGFAGLGVEVGSWYLHKERLQSGADMAAIAGAIENAMAGTGDTATGSKVIKAVRDELARNGHDPDLLTSFTVNRPPLSGPLAGDINSVEVVLTKSLDRAFSAIFMKDDVMLNARAVATGEVDGKACVLALDPIASGALTFSGSSSLDLKCGVASNSTATDSMIAQGASSAHVTAARAVGGISNDGGLVAQSSPVAYANPIADPYVDLPLPISSGCDAQNFRVKTEGMLSPGRYCGGLRIDAQATATLLPGTYVIDGGELRIGSNATVIGDEVVFIMEGTGAALKMNAQAQLNLTSPTTGEHAGVLFFQPGDGVEILTHQFNGSAGSVLDGVIYAPGGDIKVNGNASTDGGCIQIVARTIEFTGNFTIASPCSDPRFEEIGAVRALMAE